ncbi:MATE family efflux transporter [Methylobacterium sp. E-066]|uniref:MATE family efflux transporter n=1 Tax=Methylobacterium sp. E-066 TaxID=2836584 RepID=UPI001FBB1B6A|nr:MATE family efflux transporter [Methylobacterium sp. E-066]MCJ2140027.1 MATE family efflux transporter [Methylobacterium sp. E-066]
MPDTLPPAEAGRFVTGSILRHVVVMAATGSVGLMAIFVVDLLSLFYVSKLGDPKLTAAIGFAAIVQFFATAVNIGLMIAAGALVGKAVGAGDRAGARRLSSSALGLASLAAALIALLIFVLSEPLLSLIGASGETLRVAALFLDITLPSNLLLAAGMLFTGLLRAVGAARQAMMVTLAGAIVTAFLDPLLIFGAGLGVEGAAIAVCVARATFVAVGLHGVMQHQLLRLPRVADMIADAPVLTSVAGPAVLTNLAPSVASAFLARLFAGYGADAVAAAAVIDRLTPVAFGGLFALSGAIGPILAQNWGAGRFDRMRGVLREAVRVTLAYVAVVWLLLALAREPLASLFGLHGVARDLFGFFCLAGGAIWFFNGLLFLGNAAFNNLGFPIRSTLLNWGRATLGTVPPAMLGAALYGPRGVIAGMGLGSLVFGIAGLLLARRTVDRLEMRGRRLREPEGAREASQRAAPLPAGQPHPGPVS